MNLAEREKNLMMLDLAKRNSRLEKRKIQKLNNAGFNNQEILESFWLNFK